MSIATSLWHRRIVDDASRQARQDRLRRLMEDRRWSAAKVASLLDRTPGTICHWTCGSKTIPDHALRLLELLAEREREAVER